MDGRILITGGGGMLARTLARHLPMAELSMFTRRDLDITDAVAVEHQVAMSRPQAVINCAAMTAVDACEAESDRTFATNATGPANLALASARHGARLIQISTDYVFAGDLARPYHEEDACVPRTVYGRSKWAGEEAVRRHCPDHLIVRTAWLYGAGGPSFLHKMLALGAKPGPPLKVVADQHGNPTSADAIAAHLAMLLVRGVTGTVHLSCEGEASWFDLARAIFRTKGISRDLTPCTTAEFPRPAPRPVNSRLDKRALRQLGLPAMPDWRNALTTFLAEFPDG